MPYLFILICLVIILLIVLMFITLRNTVEKINNQTRAYFVDKLQEYDDLIDVKEAKLKDINDQIKNKNINKTERDNNNKDDYEFDSNIIDLFNSTDYQDKNIFELNRKINEKFVINYDKLVKDFVSYTNSNNKYDFCLNLRNRFNSDKIYELKLLLPDQLDNYLQTFLTEEEYAIYLAYRKITDSNSIEGFINYLDELAVLNNPHINIYVGNKNENYDYLSKYIKTKVVKDIYKGIKIVYKNKIYDFSLNERNV